MRGQAGHARRAGRQPHLDARGQHAAFARVVVRLWQGGQPGAREGLGQQSGTAAREPGRIPPAMVVHMHLQRGQAHLGGGGGVQHLHQVHLLAALQQVPGRPGHGVGCRAAGAGGQVDQAASGGGRAAEAAAAGEALQPSPAPSAAPRGARRRLRGLPAVVEAAPKICQWPNRNPNARVLTRDRRVIHRDHNSLTGPGDGRGCVAHGFCWSGV